MTQTTCQCGAVNVVDLDITCACGIAVCPGEKCWACNGEACFFCGAGCWSRRTDCEHDAEVRHQHRESP